MTPNMLRRLWSLVESSQSKRLLELDDRRLVEWLMNQMEMRHLSTESNHQEIHVLETYICDHLMLIRDIADDSWRDEHSFSAAVPC